MERQNMKNNPFKFPIYPHRYISIRMSGKTSYGWVGGKDGLFGFISARRLRGIYEFLKTFYGKEETVSIIKCTCINSYQDSFYGKNNRVHNPAPAANNKQGGYRCTVCGSIKPSNATIIPTPVYKGE